MTWPVVAVVAAQAASTVLILIGLLGVLRSQQRANARERDLLVNQILHLSGRTWQEPPSAERFDPEPALRLLTATANPEHLV